MVDGRPAGPARRRVGASLNIAGQQFNAREQAAHAAHVPVAVAADPVAQSFENEHLVPVGSQRLQDGFELELGARGFRPELIGHGAVGSEDEDDARGRRFARGSLKRGQSAQERQDRGREAQVSEEAATR